MNKIIQKQNKNELSRSSHQSNKTGQVSVKTTSHFIRLTVLKKNRKLIFGLFLIIILLIILIGLFGLGMLSGKVVTETKYGTNYCSSNSNCDSVKNLECINEKCTCASNFYLDPKSEFCMRRKVYLAECANNFECCCGQKCIDGKCKCENGVVLNENFIKCYRKF